MATTTNYSWTTPDDTGLVKDGASAIRTLGSSVDTTVKALNPETTLGDIAYRSSTANTNTRLALGTAGQVLTVNSGATAPEWATPATPTTGANWSLLNAGGTSLTGATTVTVSGISGKDKIFILIRGGSTASGGPDIGLRINADTAANYISNGMKLEVGSTYSTNLGNVSSQSGSTSYLFAVGSSNAAFTVDAYLEITGCNSSGVKAIKAASGVLAGGGSGAGLFANGGFWNNSATVTSVSVFSSAGNWDAGTIFVYTSA